MADNVDPALRLLDHERLAAFVRRRQEAGLGDLHLDVRPLRGGLQAAAVARVRARFVDGRGRRRSDVFVVKRLDGHAVREAAIYETLLAGVGAPAPRLLGVDGVGATTRYLYLEWVIRGRGPGSRAVLLDWARARRGSPLEDVSSWLQSLGYWELEARRRHDTLLRRYLKARAFAGELSRAVRDAYWLAAACNVLAGGPPPPPAPPTPVG